jgi:hypothetical protein
VNSFNSPEAQPTTGWALVAHLLYGALLGVFAFLAIYIGNESMAYVGQEARMEVNGQWKEVTPLRLVPMKAGEFFSRNGHLLPWVGLLALVIAGAARYSSRWLTPNSRPMGAFFIGTLLGLGGAVLAERYLALGTTGPSLTSAMVMATAIASYAMTSLPVYRGIGGRVGDVVLLLIASTFGIVWTLLLRTMFV